MPCNDRPMVGPMHNDLPLARWTRALRHGLILIGFLTASGCATLSREECQTADWYAIGYEDGLRGKAASRIGDHREACAEHGITPDLARYNDGRKAGLNEYCRPRKGFLRGASGKSYPGVCPAALERDYLAAYEDGRAIYRARKAVRSLKYALDRQVEHLDSLADSIRGHEAALVQHGTNRKRRAALLAEIRALEDEAAEIEADIEELEHQLLHEQDRVAELEAAARQWN